MFEMALRYWGKGSWQICNHHLIVHIKSEFQHLAGEWGFTDITCININFSYLFCCKDISKITPKIDSSAHSSKLKTEMTCHNSHTQNAQQCNTRCQFLLGRQVLAILHLKIHFKNFVNL